MCPNGLEHLQSCQGYVIAPCMSKIKELDAFAKSCNSRLLYLFVSTSSQVFWQFDAKEIDRQSRQLGGIKRANSNHKLAPVLLSGQ